MLPTRALLTAARFGLLIEVAKLVEIIGCDHEANFLGGEIKILPLASRGIITNAPSVSTKFALL